MDQILSNLKEFRVLQQISFCLHIFQNINLILTIEIIWHLWVKECDPPARQQRSNNVLAPTYSVWGVPPPTIWYEPPLMLQISNITPHTYFNIYTYLHPKILGLYFYFVEKASLYKHQVDQTKSKQFKVSDRPPNSLVARLCNLRKILHDGGTKMRAVAKFSLSPLLRRDLCSSRSPHKRWNPNLAPMVLLLCLPPATKCYCRAKKHLFSSSPTTLAGWSGRCKREWTDPDIKM